MAIDTPEKIFATEGILAETGLSLPTTVEFLNLIKKDWTQLQASAFTVSEGLAAILSACLETAEEEADG